MSKGKGGSMHVLTKTVFGCHIIVGAGVPIGAGIAFAAKYIQKSEHRDVDQGEIFEAFNTTRLWNLPYVFAVCENNQYGIGTSIERSCVNPVFCTRGDTIPGIQANGMNVIATRQATAFAKRWVVEFVHVPLL
ncbi:Thiamin diphosphate-binding protein [Fistulina hepatica ATCC 64428]|uniref:Thiamin diphosphate-binding protein n=1 Tax=Fistulina hepatica ATCC 64428 TaxID=1128425 RepID=A0A0D7AFF4_9AGAR|nr:Thiamin diphosphate-binding protein [Fistulina hepatica ATCC 64428]